MNMVSKKRALDKIYKRRDRYEIPEWQRDDVWDTEKKQGLIDSVLRGWKLPKFYFLKVDDDPEEFEVVDGQQRLSAIFDFFDNTLSLSAESTKRFKASCYKDLPSANSDAFDDFEIEYDEIADADEPELKEFFQRLQRGLPLTSSEKLNAVHSQLRDYCRSLSRHKFFAKKVAFADKRYAHFDVAAKVAAIEIEGFDAGLRFDDLKTTFESQQGFSTGSAIARRLRATVDFLDKAFAKKSPELRNRSIVQSIVTLAARIVGTGRGAGHERAFRNFVEKFMAEFSKQVELGQAATDPDYLLFQRSVNANVRSGARTRHEILLRKMFIIEPTLGDSFDSTVVGEAGLSGAIGRAGASVCDLITNANAANAAKHGEDLFKATNKTVSTLTRISRPIKDYEAYKSFISDLYFVFRESCGPRLDNKTIPSFADVNDLRTDLQHDVDHGKVGKIAAKRKKLGSAFAKYSGASTPSTMSPDRFPIFQSNLLAALEFDLRALIGHI
jgi:hypothetical protein